MTKLTLEVLFKIGALVYLKTDRNQMQRLVVGYRVRGNLEIVYELQTSDEDVTIHYDFEISSEKDLIMNSTN